MAGFFKYDLNKLFGGAVRVLYAPLSVTKPDDLSDIIDLVSPYAVKTGWIDLGATGGPFQYSRNLTVAGWNIQQATAAAFEEPTDVTRSFSVPAAEVKPEILEILEESTGIDTIAAAALKSAQKAVPFGNIEDLTPYRVAFIGRRKKAQGLVTEGAGGLTRGALAGAVAFYATITADNAQISVAEGDMSTVPLNFSVKPDPAATVEGEESGIWLFEDAGQTIALT